jgi:predicted MFS family arabinose efflux permease
MPSTRRVREQVVRKILRIRNARIFLFGDVVSTLGDSSLWFAMAIWMKEMTGSSAWAGLVFFCYIAGNLFSPFGGVLADRFPRRPLLVVANLLSAAIVLPIALVHGRGDSWIVYLVTFLYGATGSVIGAAQSALVPALLPPDLLAEANGAQRTLNAGLQLVTPLIGAGLFTVVGGAVIAEIDAGTFLIAVASLLLLRMAPAPDAAVDGGTGGAAADGGGPDGHRGMAAGFLFIWGDPVLRAIMLALGFSVLTIGFTESANFSVVTVGLHHSASFLGVLTTVQGVGAVLGGMTAAPLLKRVSEPVLLAMGLACLTLAMLGLAVPDLVVILAGMVVAGFVGPWVGVAGVTAFQRRTPPAMMGRVFGVLGLTLTIPQAASIGIGAALITVVNYRVLLVLVAVVAAGSGLFLIGQPGIRRRAVPGTVRPDAGASGSVESAGGPAVSPEHEQLASRTVG